MREAIVPRRAGLTYKIVNHWCESTAQLWDGRGGRITIRDEFPSDLFKYTQSALRLKASAAKKRQNPKARKDSNVEKSGDVRLAEEVPHETTLAATSEPETESVPQL